MIKDLEEWATVLGYVGSSRDVIRDLMRRIQETRKRSGDKKMKTGNNLNMLWYLKLFSTATKENRVAIFQIFGEMLTGWLHWRQVESNSCFCLQSLTMPCAPRPLETSKESKSEGQSCFSVATKQLSSSWPVLSTCCSWLDALSWVGWASSLLLTATLWVAYVWIFMQPPKFRC